MGLVVASGVVSIVLGVLLLAGFPGTAAWALGLVFGISLLSTGVSTVMVGSGVHRQVAALEFGSESAGWPRSGALQVGPGVGRSSHISRPWVDTIGESGSNRPDSSNGLSGSTGSLTLWLRFAERHGPVASATVYPGRPTRPPRTSTA